MVNFGDILVVRLTPFDALWLWPIAYTITPSHIKIVWKLILEGIALVVYMLLLAFPLAVK